MLQKIVFSFNRPIFLDCFLLSVIKYFDISNFYVLYNTNDSLYEKGYKYLQEKYKEYNIKFIKESKSKISTYMELIKTSAYPRNFYRFIKYKYYKKLTDFRRELVDIITHNDSNNIVFFTDDTVFYKRCEINDEIIKLINNDPLHSSFHLRFGYNYKNKPLDMVNIYDDIYYWNLNKNKDKDFSYRFSVDGQIFNKKILINLLNKILFKNPTTLESNINFYCQKNNLFFNGFCFKENVLIGTEINKVKEYLDKNQLYIDNKKLNEYYLDGYIMNYIFDTNNISCFRPNLKDIILVKNDKEFISIFSNINNWIRII